MGVGDSRSCAFTFRALPTTTPRTISFGLRVSSDQVDPVALNNQVGAFFAVSSFDVISDLSVTVSQVPSTGLVPLDGSGRVYVTLRNVGPDAAASARVYSDYYQPPYYESHAFLFFGVPEDPCSTRVDVELNYARVITGSGQGLAAGASLTCVIGIERRAGATNGTYMLGWDTSLAGYGSNDPNPANNRAVIGLGISPVSSVPLLSHWAWLATLAVLVAVPAWRWLRRMPARPAA